MKLALAALIAIPARHRMIDAINLRDRLALGVDLGAAAVDDQAVVGLGVSAIDALAVRFDQTQPACERRRIAA